MKKIFNSRALALILVLAMAVSLFTFSASAATTESLSGHGSNISTITATGVNYETVEYATSTDIHGTVYDYYLAVPSGTANGTELTATFTAADGQPDGFVISKFGKNVPNPPQGIYYIASGASNTYTATMTDGAALATAYVHKDTRKCRNVQCQNSMKSAARSRAVSYLSPKDVHLSLHCVHSFGFCVVRTKNVRNFVHRVQGFAPIRRRWLPGGRLAALHGRNLGCGCVTLTVLPGKTAAAIDAAL